MADKSIIIDVIFSKLMTFSKNLFETLAGTDESNAKDNWNKTVTC